MHKIHLLLLCASTILLTQNALARNYSEIVRDIKNIAKRYPKVTQEISIGKSDNGQDIIGLKIGSGSINNLVVATHHGNEFASTAVAVAFAESLAKSPIKEMAVFVVPVLNISGYNDGDRYEENAKGHFDPNRDYPGPCGTEGPFHLASTAALAKFIEKENIVSSATLHTFYPAVVYPWGISTHDRDTPYTELFTKLAEWSTEESKYQIGNSSDVVYPADGTFEDYAFWKHGIWSLLFELGYSHSPSNEDIKKTIEANMPGLRRFLANAPRERAKDHEFRGQCDLSLMKLDRHDE